MTTKLEGKLAPIITVIFQQFIYKNCYTKNGLLLRLSVSLRFHEKKKKRNQCSFSSTDWKSQSGNCFVRARYLVPVVSKNASRCLVIVELFPEFHHQQKCSGTSCLYGDNTNPCCARKAQVFSIQCICIEFHDWDWLVLERANLMIKIGDLKQAKRVNEIH
jgi:hypothetical protein